jgi:amino acid transporter
LNDRAVPWVPVVALGGLSLAVALVVAVTHAWQVLVATGASLEAMIYAVAGYCTLRLRSREPDRHRPFKVRGVRVLGLGGLAVFGTLSAVASVSVDDRFDPVPLAIIAVAAATSAFYVVRVLPGVRAAEEARRAATLRRRPPRPPPAGGAG